MKQQTATSEVLRIISNSPTEIQPVQPKMPVACGMRTMR
jgi:hypothetical protein